MHVNCKDVALQVLRRVYEDDKQVYVIGRWINLGYSGKPTFLTGPERIEIKDRTQWVKIPQKILFQVRTKEGLPPDEAREYL
jgi:hypothetical protein